MSEADAAEKEAAAVNPETAPKNSVDARGERYASNKMLIVCDGALDQGDVRNLLDEAGVETTDVNLVSKSLGGNDVLLEVFYEGNEDPRDLSERLHEEDFVESAEPDYVQTLCDTEEIPAAESPSDSLSATVNDTYAGHQWALSAIGAEAAWDYAKADGSVTVAVLDSGVDYSHADLADNCILDSYAKNTYTGGTGYYSVYDIVGHGTHVAGIISACSNNSAGVSGVSYNAKILPIKVTYSSDGSMYSSDVIEAIDYVISLKAQADAPDYIKNIKVINLSLGGYVYSETYESAVQRAYDAGLLVVAAAGNDATDTPHYPAAYDGAFAVTALKESSVAPYVEVDTSYSNYGIFVDISAPGTDIYSTTRGGGYGYKSGTSMATAMVSGVAALVFAGMGDEVPDYMDTPAWARSLIEVGSTDLLDSGWDQWSGNGAVCASETVSRSMWRPISEAVVEEIPDQKYTGEPVVPKPVVTYMGTELVEGTDYTLRYSDNVKEGKAMVVIGGIGDYFGDIAVSFNIVDFKSIEDADFEAIPDQEYTGSALEPAVTASFEGEQLVLGEDFAVAYANNVDPGAAEVVVAGAGKFVGQKSLSFQIKPKVISAPVAKADLVYTGEEQEGVSAGEGYTLSGTTSATRVGSYVVTATLKNGYVWEGGSTADCVIEWSIGPERSVERPSAVDGLVYNGEAQQGVLPDAEYGEKAYSLGGTFEAVDAGMYEAEATLNPGYHWTDGGYDSVVVTWKIARCPVDVPEGGSFEYMPDGSHEILDGLVGDAGALRVWGDDSFGQLGGGSSDDEDEGSPLESLGEVKALSLGYYHSAAVTEDGSLYTWGENSSGQLGDGSTTSEERPVEILDDVVSVSLGGYHSAAVTEDGSLYTWGDNASGQLGNGTYEDAHEPVKVLDGVVAVSLGGYHSAAVTEDGSLYMWGENSYGQLGDGSTAGQASPVKVLDGVKAVSLGYCHSAAVTEDGSLYAWGDNSYGQLGDGGTAGKNIPTKIMGGMKAVSLGYYHSAAVGEDGQLYAWGDNGYGQLGDGTTTNRRQPTAVLEDVKAVSLGGRHSAALTNSGQLYTWGDNSYGQLGGDSASYRSKPALLAGDVLFASLGGDHSACVVATAWQNSMFVVSGETEASEVGTYTVMVQPGPNYIWRDGTTDSREVEWSITPRVIHADALASEGLVYSGQRQIGVQSGDGYSLSGTLTAVGAGEYSAEATLWDSNYIWSDGTVDAKKIAWSISPATLTAAYVGEQIAWGEEPALKVDVTGFVAGESSADAAGYVAPYVTAPAGWEAGGAYELCPEGGAASNYVFEYVPGTLEVGFVPLTEADISLSAKTVRYTGKVQKPAVSVMLGGEELVEGVDYEVVYEGDFVKAGTYSVIVRGIGEREGEKTLEFSILRKTLASSDVTLSYASAVYNGSAKKPAATVKVNGVKQAASGYTVTYWNKAKTAQVAPKAVGTYWVKVVSKTSANTTGAVWKKLVINPKAATGLALTRLNNGFKAKWTKPSHQVTGYQVSYKRVGTTTWYAKNVVGYKVVTKSVTGLKDKKSYQVRVRSYKTVGGVKYYSAWTVVKTVKTS